MITLVSIVFSFLQPKISALEHNKPNLEMRSLSGQLHIFTTFKDLSPLATDLLEGDFETLSQEKGYERV